MSLGCCADAAKPESRKRRRGGEAARYVFLAGNPNSGKSTLFNALTGLRARVGNYPGVTVERKEGRLRGSPVQAPIRVLDLPGTYSLSPRSIDERIARDALLGRLEGCPPPDLVVVIVDAVNIERNLYLASQIFELGRPAFLAVNMMDLAGQNGIEIDFERIERVFGRRVFPMTASSGQGVAALREAILAELAKPPEEANRSERLRPARVPMPPPVEKEIEELEGVILKARPHRAATARMEALLALSDEGTERDLAADYGPEFAEAAAAARRRLEAAGADWRSEPIEARYRWLEENLRKAIRARVMPEQTPSDRIDRILVHPWLGLLALAAVLFLLFQSIFVLADLPSGLLEHGVIRLGEWASGWMPPGPLRGLLVGGVIHGVGAVLVFLPQICILFFLIGVLEDSGYMARGAFLMDWLMRKFGLHGKSFIPLLSSFACAVPGVMATRTIESARERLATIFVAPFMSCSARLPVYTLLIGACIPERKVFGPIGLRGLVLMGLYLLGVVMALLTALVFKKTLLRRRESFLILELPPYRKPVLSVVLRHVWERASVFLTRAGTVILAANIVLWFLVNYPRGGEAKEPAAPPAATAPSRALDAPTTAAAAVEAQGGGTAASFENSYAARMGRLIEPIIRPLGFDWRIGVGILSSFVARELFVSTMAAIYRRDGAGTEEESLAEILRRPAHQGGGGFTLAVGLALMTFYALALQCASTVAVVWRETNSWRWPLAQWLYMGALAWILAFLVRRAVFWLGGA